MPRSVAPHFRNATPPLSPDDDVHEASTLTGGNFGARIAGSPVVLVAEDDADGREVLAEYLAHLGCRVLIAANGEDAVHLALLTAPDLVVTDVAMPKMDGLEATRRLRAEPLTRRTPVLAVTGYGKSWEEKARAAGCDAFLIKPLVLEELERVLASLLPALALARARAARPPSE